MYLHSDRRITYSKMPLNTYMLSESISFGEALLLMEKIITVNRIENKSFT